MPLWNHFSWLRAVCGKQEKLVLKWALAPEPALELPWSKMGKWACVGLWTINFIVSSHDMKSEREMRPCLCGCCVQTSREYTTDITSCCSPLRTYQISLFDLELCKNNKQIDFLGLEKKKKIQTKFCQVFLSVGRSARMQLKADRGGS